MMAATLGKKTERESPRGGKRLFVSVLGAVALGCLAVRAEFPLQWESTVFDVPTAYSADSYVTGGETNGVKAVFLSSVPYLGKETRVFAYWGLPSGASAEHPAPAMVLVHGGGGSAFYRWVKFWNDQGYAAIAMDLNGCVSGNTVGEEQHGHFKHAWAGPEGCGGNALIDAADHTLKDQWMYHAVAAVIRSHSFLRAQPGVDANHVGVTGVSWGGVVNCVVAAVDDRFAFAFPVYGCGSLYDDISSWTQASYYVRGVPFSPTGTANARWAAVSDPKHYLPEAKIPVLWLNGTNDKNFSLLSTARSYDQVPGEKHLALRVRLTHSHSATSEQAPEIVAAADRYLRGGVAFPTMVTAAKIAGAIVSATYSDAAELPVASATLDYTCDNLPIWFSNTWQSVEATIDPATKTVSATLPAGVKYAYLSVETATRVRASTPMLMPLDFARADKPYPHFIVDNGYVVTNALTHGIRICAELFADKKDTLVCPDLFWDNYELVFQEAVGCKVEHFNTFKKGAFDVVAMKAALLAPGEKKILILNFPNNPTGYTATLEDAKKIVVICDDAYFGLVYEKGIHEESLFAEFSDLH